LERLAKDWTAPIYAFFKPEPIIEHVDGRRCHSFQCAARSCMFRSRGVRRYLDKSDFNSTGNLRKHAKKCWGEDVVKAADQAKTADEVRATKGTGPLNLQSITAAFKRSGKGKVTYSHQQHTKTESRYSLMKTGRPSYYIPSAKTVSRDVKQVFVKARKRIAKMLQEHDGALSFGTDAWTSPNHKAFIAVTSHFEIDGSPISLLLDLVEVAKSHSGINLAVAF
ncbi:hypothetical protein BD410DRAFT_682605, partial [Rickenella mellea]